MRLVYLQRIYNATVATGLDFQMPNAAHQPRRALRAVGCMRLFGGSRWSRPAVRGAPSSPRPAFKREELPVSGDAPKDVTAAFPEAEPGARDQVSYGAGDKNLIGNG